MVRRVAIMMLAAVFVEVQMARESVLPPGIAPRGLNLAQASEYVGVCPSTFKKLVKRGVVRPTDLAGIDRNIYDRRALDHAMSALAAKGVER